MKTLRSIICIGASVLATAMSVHAAPYASGVSNNAAGSVSFWLNSSPGAGNTIVTGYPSGNTLATVPTTPVQGSNNFLLLGDTSYSIKVNHTGTGAPAIETIAAGNVVNTSWGGSPDPRGMAVNAYPTNGPTFGSVYMCNGAAGTLHGLGLFPTHADMTYAFGATSAGLDSGSFSGGSAGSAPYKASVSRYDGSVVISSIDPTVGGVIQFNGYLQSSSSATLLSHGQNTTGSAVSPYHGEIYGASRTTGSIGSGNLVLYTFDYTMPTPAAVNSTFGGLSNAVGINAAFYNSAYKGSVITAAHAYCNINRYTLNSTAPATALPDLTLNYGLTIAAALPGDMDVNPTNGYIYTTSERAAPGSAPWLQVFDKTGNTNLYTSASSATTDDIATLLANYDAGADLNGCLLRVSPDGKYVALAGYDGYIAIFNLTNGIPDLSTYNLIKPGYIGSAPRGVDWDAADNVYLLSSGSGFLYIYDLGLTTTCITSNTTANTAGSFYYSTPNVQASVTATTPIGYQPNNSYAMANLSTSAAVPVVFTISLNAAQAGPITVNYTLSGTATNVSNYAVTGGTATSVTLLAGATSTNIIITPTATPAVGPSLSVVLSLMGGATYSAVTPTSATGSIANSGAETVAFSAVGASTMYRGLANDFVTFFMQRWGDTNVAFSVPSSSLVMSGAAVYNTDYSADPQNGSWSVPATAGTPGVNVLAGDTFETVEVGLPISHATYTGPLGLTITLSSGTGYTASTAITGSALVESATLLDNLNAPETAVMWSDPLSSATDTNNWNVTFSINNGVLPWYFPANQGVTGMVPYNGIPTNDYDADFGYLLEEDYVPNGPQGQTTALRVTCNKLTADGAWTSEVNLYPNNAPLFAGNFAYRFSMYLVRGCGSASATEYAIFGVNHYGTNIVGWDGSTVQGTGAATFSYTNADGQWYGVVSDIAQTSAVGGYGADYLELTGTNTAFAHTQFPASGYWTDSGSTWAAWTNQFKNPVCYNAGNAVGSGALPNEAIAPGCVANQSGWYADSYSSGTCPVAGVPPPGPWVDCEVAQSNGIITMSLNRTVVFTKNTVTSPTIYTNGTVMLGYLDPYSSEGTGGGVYYVNARVLELSPSITNQPVAVNVGAGTNASFSVGVVGYGPFTNVWYLGATPILTNIDAGTPSIYNNIDTIAFTPALPANAGSYKVVVSDSSGISVTSSVVTLTVGLPPAITVPPANTIAYIGKNVTFPITATGTATLTYSWKTNSVLAANGSAGSHIAGATTATLSVTNLVAANAGTVAVTVANAYGTATASANLTVLSALQPFTNSYATGTGIAFQFNTMDPADTTGSFIVLGSTNLTWANSGLGTTAEGFVVLSPQPGITVDGTGTNFTVNVTTNGIYPFVAYMVKHN